MVKLFIINKLYLKGEFVVLIKGVCNYVFFLKIDINYFLNVLYKNLSYVNFINVSSLLFNVNRNYLYKYILKK